VELEPKNKRLHQPTRSHSILIESQLGRLSVRDHLGPRLSDKSDS